MTAPATPHIPVTSSVVERLRNDAVCQNRMHGADPLCAEAADIITALVEALDDIRIHCLADIEAEEQADSPNEHALRLYRARLDKADAALTKARP